MQQADYRPQDWYTRIPAYQADAIYDLIRSVEGVLQTKYHASPDGIYRLAVLQASYEGCIRQLGGKIASS